MTEQAPERFCQWCVVELKGHRRLAGLVTEVQIAGHGFLRIDVPNAEGTTIASPLVQPSTIYQLTPVTADLALRAATSHQFRPDPVTEWELPPLEPSGPSSDGSDGPF